MVTLLPHLTHVLQPIDLSWARSFKSRFRDVMRALMPQSELERCYRELRLPFHRPHFSGPGING